MTACASWWPRSARIERDTGRPIGILVDLQGPKLRLGTFAGGQAMVANGASFVLDADPAPGDATRVYLPHPEIFRGIEPGHTLLLDDGKVRLTATAVEPDKITAQVVVGGRLSDRKGVSLPDTTIPFSALTEKDRSDLDAALDTGIDWVALSFIQRPEDIAEAKKITRGRAAVMAKIEKPQAVERLDEIIDLADALMVARGDLGVEMPLEKVPGVQKQMTRLGRATGKPVVVATQMLELMISMPGADARRSLRRRHRHLRRRRRGDAVGGIGGRQISGGGGRDHEPHRRGGRKRTRSTAASSRPSAPSRRRPAPTPSPTPRAKSPRRSISPPSCAGPRPARPRCAWRASGRSRRSSPSRPTSRPAGGCRWCGACIAWSPRTRTTRTTWSTAPAASPSAKASPSRASASSSSPAFRFGTPGATNMVRIAYVGRGGRRGVSGAG